MGPEGTGSLSATSPPAPRPPHGLHLACRECQRKKIKCDRTYPCGQCSRSGLPCMPSTRKPRARTGAKTADAELRQRIAKLEKLVENFQGDEDKDHSENPETKFPSFQPTTSPFKIGPEQPGTNNISTPVALEAMSPSTNKYVAGYFWSSLTSEVKALAEVLEESDVSDDDSTSPGITPAAAAFPIGPGHIQNSGYELIFCTPGTLYIMPGAIEEPNHALGAKLLHSYLEHVESTYKLFHVPSLRAFIESDQPYLGNPSDHPSNKVLRAAIYFAGMNAYTPDECQTDFGKPLPEMVQGTRRLVDIALYQADPLNTTELATLQAMTVYTAAIRVVDTSRRAWSMVGLVARIATAMGCHRELPGESVFMAELRRRLWHGVVFLDCYSSIDRGSEPAIHPDSFSRSLPSNINDGDIDEHSMSVTEREGEMTDMSMSLMVAEASVMTLRFAYPEDGALGGSEAWQKRLDMAYQYQQRTKERLLQYCNPEIPSHKRWIGTAHAACASIMLRAVRPMSYSSTPAPRVDSPWVMQLALNILRISDQLWSIHSVKWRRMPWIPWHALAVALAGLCSVRGTELANEAWRLVDIAMTRYSGDIADARNGMLWRPLEKLRKKAANFRDAPNPQSDPIPMPTPVSLCGPNISHIPIQQQQPFASGPNLITSSIVMDNVPGIVDPMPDIDVTKSLLDFPSDIQASLPVDNSWLDWESMMRDMDELKAEDHVMQWT